MFAKVALSHSGASITLMSGRRKSSLSGCWARICSSVSVSRLRIFLKNFTSEYSMRLSVLVQILVSCDITLIWDRLFPLCNSYRIKACV